jgi:hypothetical protein
MAGMFWDADRTMCKRCQPGTYWPATTGLETDACIPCANPTTGDKTLAKSKYGAKSCPAYPSKPVKQHPLNG